MRTKRSRVGLLALVLSLSAMVAGTAPVSAAERGFVDVQGCYFGTGETTVPAGTDFDIFAGWLATSRGQDLAFLNSVKTTLTFDGGDPIAGADAYGTELIRIVREPRFQLWGTFWLYPYAALNVGESVTVYHDWTLRVPIYDGFFHFARGIIFGGTCTITAVAPA
jgi:hypothetical protein